MLCLLASSPAFADEYLGKLSENSYNTDSTSNAYGQYGSEYSDKSINNSYGRYGSEHSNDSPTNRYGEGLSIYGDDDG